MDAARYLEMASVITALAWVSMMADLRFAVMSRAGLLTLAMLFLSVLPLVAADPPGKSTPVVSRPAWASAVGDDQYGHWADLTVKTVTQRMRWIAPGTFTMGSPKSDPDAVLQAGDIPVGEGRETQHEVTLSKGFWMADSHCTQALWVAVMDKNPSQFKGDLQRPVDTVNWVMAKDFLAAFNGLVKGSVFDLPSEAQWEYACRAGTQTPFAGASLDEMGWDKSNCGMPTTTHPVKQKSANPWGLYDMHGNAWQWCLDWEGDYPLGMATDPSGPANGKLRISRGGCVFREAKYCRSACRASRVARSQERGDQQHGLPFLRQVLWTVNPRRSDGRHAG